MLMMGVATWMFPRPARDDPRYRPELGQLAGTTLFVLSMWWRVRMPPAAAPPVSLTTP